MKASFDGARRNLANAYNELAEIMNDDLCASDKDSCKRPMDNLMAAVGGLLCMYDDSQTDANVIEMELQEVITAEHDPNNYKIRGKCGSCRSFYLNGGNCTFSKDPDDLNGCWIGLTEEFEKLP